MPMSFGHIISELTVTIKNRVSSNSEKSYVSFLMNAGLDKILKKIGEESSEVIIAAKNKDKEELIYELSDLFFHCLVLMEKKEITLEHISSELERRMNKSGIEEKNKRLKNA